MTSIHYMMSTLNVIKHGLCKTFVNIQKFIIPEFVISGVDCSPWAILQKMSEEKIHSKVRPTFVWDQELKEDSILWKMRCHSEKLLKLQNYSFSNWWLLIGVAMVMHVDTIWFCQFRAVSPGPFHSVSVVSFLLGKFNAQKNCAELRVGPEGLF